MNKPKVTIIFGTYRDTSLILPSIESLIESDYDDFISYIVDDNLPTDVETIDTVDKIVSQYSDPRFFVVKNDVNIGVPHVFKKWIDLVSTPYFLIFGAGDRIQKDAIGKMVGFLDQNPIASFVYGNEYFDDPATGPREIKKKKINTGVYDPLRFLEFHLVGGVENLGWSQTSAMYRTELFRYFQIPVKFFHYWDHYFHCTYLLHSKMIGHIEENLAVRHVDPKLSGWASINIFTDKFERLIQSDKFIDEYSTKLIRLGHPIRKYKRLIAYKIARRIYFGENRQQITFLINIIARNLVSSISINSLYLLIYPIIVGVKLVLKFKKRNV